MNDAPVMLFYCRKCKHVVKDPVRKGKKYVYSCTTCGSDDVVFGTKHAICDFFQIKEVQLERMLSNTAAE